MANPMLAAPSELMVERARSRVARTSAGIMAHPPSGRNRIRRAAGGPAVSSSGQAQAASSPAVMLMANPSMATLNAKETISWRITVRRMEVWVVDTSAVWQAAAIVKEK